MTDRTLTVAKLVTDHIDGIMIEGDAFDFRYHTEVGEQVAERKDGKKHGELTV